MGNPLVRRLLNRPFLRLRGRVLRYEAPAHLQSLFMGSEVYSEDPADLLAALATPSQETDSRKQTGLLFPNFYDSGERLRALLADLVRIYRPQKIMETGVAHGRSTQMFLTAIQDARKVDSSYDPAVHSVDVDPRTKNLKMVANARWTFHLLTPENNLENIFNEIGEIDLFFHDSDHGYRNQMKEYELAWHYLRPGGLLVSDDVSWSNAFLDFARQVKVKPLILSEAPAVAGILRRTKA